MNDIEEREKKGSLEIALEKCKAESKERGYLGEKVEFHQKPQIDDHERRKIEAGLDEKILDRIEILYGHWIPQNRLAEARKENVQFQEKTRFQSELRSRLGQQKPNVERIVGYETGNNIRVEKNTEAPGTLVHERLHSVSHPEARKILGTHLYEGFTEELASRESDFQLRLHNYENTREGILKTEKPREYYPENRATLRLIMARVPESALMEAYFQGDDSRIEEFIDCDGGKGTWRKIRELLEKAENEKDLQALQRARELLSGKS